DPADAILSLLQTFDRPIVVMASHGRRGVKRMTLGSVTFDVVQRATGPVLVVPMSDDEAEAHVPVALDRVLIPLDRSPTAETAIDAALCTLGDRPLTVRVVQIVPLLAQRSSQHAARHHATASEVALDYLGRIANPLVARGHDVSTAVAIGSTEDEIAREACEFRAELIVMATRGRTGIGRMLFGSVAEGLTQIGHCPVLVINPGTALLESLLPGSGASDASPPSTRRARDLMVSPVITAGEDTSLEEVARLMLDNHIGCLPIVNESGALTGIITESDFAGKEHTPPFSVFRMPQLFGEWIPRAGIERLHKAGRSMQARQIMSWNPVVVTSDEPVASIIAKLARHDINSVPVVDNGVLTGIITRHDLIKMIARDTAENVEQSGSGRGG
ncbi:MAG TPA: universal stress protein, partial [Thermomicrobiales bacterium]|nr:universal stress protein [Thermomicrobiales bacterium]